MVDLSSLAKGLQVNPLPEPYVRDNSVPHAPKRTPNLTKKEEELAVANALRYFPAETHEVLAPEFAEELKLYGHIYMYRFMPKDYEMKTYNFDLYPQKSRRSACIMGMIMNNLDKAVAQFPQELITYGGQGGVFSNWAQYHLTMKYLSTMTDDQTLTLHSGHPAGLFPSSFEAPNMIVTNGMVIPNYSSTKDYDKMYALGVSQYGQMTAGSFCYIGPQGIVHGTTITIMNAARKYCGSNDMKGKLFVTAGLGGMSGAQPKAATIAGAVSITAEVHESALMKRKEQGWVMESSDNLDEIVKMAHDGIQAKKTVSIAYLGNVVDLWERLADEDLVPSVGSDQTSCHNPYGGGYYPTGMTYDESNALMASDPAAFKKLVDASLVRQVNAINRLTKKGMFWFDYGNSFMLSASRAGAEIMNADNTGFRYPSYVEEFMGDIFSLGFGPFRWVCLSDKPEDLEMTDKLARDEIVKLMKVAPTRTTQQYDDNLKWIEQAGEHKLVVGSQARILYSDVEGRSNIASSFNEAVKDGRLSGPVVISRDHHDVSGTDSPWRETSNIRDGSMFCADMAVQNFCGDAMRGATWVALHNGGGTGWGEAINGGFGLVLDGSDEQGDKARKMLHWDVLNGVTRRAWAGNDNALDAITRAGARNSQLNVTLPVKADAELVAKSLASATENQAA